MVDELVDSRNADEVFARRNSIARSPPARGGPPATPSRGASSREEEEPQKKRKMPDTETDTAEREVNKRRENPAIRMVRDWMDAVANYSRSLDKLVEENSNTKKEIKEVVGRLRRCMETVRKPAITNWLEDNRWEVAPKQTKHASTLTTGGSKGVSAGTQTLDVGDLVPRSDRERQRSREEVFEKARDPGVLPTFLKGKWRREWYSNTGLVQGSPVTEDSGDLALMLTAQEREMDKGIARVFRDRYPALRRLNAKDRIQWIMTTCKLQLESEGDEQEESRRVVYKGYVESLGDVEVLSILDRLREAATKNDSEMISFPVIQGIAGDKMRKLTEIAFVGSKIKVNIHVPKGVNNETRLGEGGPSKNKTKERTTDAVFIRQGDKPYAEVLGGLKAVMASDPTASKVKGVRKVKDGRLLLMINKGEGNVESIREAIEGKMEGAIITVGEEKRNWKRLKLAGMDALTTREEVERAIAGQFREEGEIPLEIGEMRPTQGDNRTVYIKIEKRRAEKLVRIGKIRIGFNMCRMEEWIPLSRCY